MSFRDRHLWMVIASGTLLGALGVLLSVWGNPQNSGICVSCFLENSVGALGMHDNPRMQYLRPELIGFVLGALACSRAFGEFRSRGGSAPLPRLFSGFFLMVGCAVFIGCPIKLFLRFTAGDLTAAAGVVGLVIGVWAGLRMMTEGVQLATPRCQPGAGLLVPGVFAMFLVFLLVRPGFLVFSERGSSAQHAPWLIALASGLALGAFAQRSRFCVTGAIRDTFLLGRRSPLLWGIVSFAGMAVVFNLATGNFRPGLYGQPGAHLEFIWSFLGMALVGWISVLIGGCPFRQLIKAGEGDADAGLVVVGMLLGGALVQAWGIAASAAGVPLYGKAAVVVGFIFVFGISLVSRERAPAD